MERRGGGSRCRSRLGAAAACVTAIVVVACALVVVNGGRRAQRPRWAAVAAAGGLPSVAELIHTHALFSPSPKRWSVFSASPFFGGAHPSAQGGVDCPGGCSIGWWPVQQQVRARGADFQFIHDGSARRHLRRLQPRQLLGLWAHETLDLLERPADHWAAYDVEMTYRAVSVYRASYVGAVVPYMRVRAGPGGAAARLREIRTWGDVFPAPVPAHQRRRLAAGSVTFASSHCGSRSGREALVRALGELVPVTVVGATCLRNASPALLALGREEQRSHFRQYKFALAFENRVCVDYVTEKALLPLVLGQVPVILGAPNVAEHMPPGSFIDVADYPSPAALAAHLRHLDADSAAYARYHAWRAASFEAYGVFLRRELLRFIGVAHHAAASLGRPGGGAAASTPSPQEDDGGGPGADVVALTSLCVRCAMCYGINEWVGANGWAPLPPAPSQIVRDADAALPPPPPLAARRGIPPFGGSCAPPWDAERGVQPPLHGNATRLDVVRAEEWYGRMGAAVPAIVADRRVRSASASSASRRFT